MTPNVLSPPNSTVREGAGTSARAGPGDAASGSDNCTTNGSDVFYSPCGATSNGTNESFTGVTSVNGNALQPPKSADTSMEVAKATQVGHGQLSSDPMLSPPELVVNGGEKPNVDDATTSAAAAASNAPAANATTTASSTSSGAKIGESEDDEDEEEMEPSPTYSVKFSDAAGTIKRDVDSDDITRLKRAPTRDTIRTFIKGCARRVRWRDSNVWVVKDEVVRELDLPCKYPELTYAVVTSAMSPVKRRRSSLTSPGEAKKGGASGSSKRTRTPKGPMKQMTLLDMVTGTPVANPPSKAQQAKARSSLGGNEAETPTKQTKKPMPSTPKTPDGKPAKPARSRPSKAEQEKAKAAAVPAVPKTLPMSKANKTICDKIKNLDTSQDQPRGYVSRVLTQAARTLSTPERNTLPPQQRKLVEDKIAQRLKMEELKKMTPEERKAKTEEERKKKQEERRLLKVQQRLIEKESNRVREDDEIEHAKPLPDLEAVSLPAGLCNESFGDLAMVVEFLHVFQQVLAPQATAPIASAGSLAQALVKGSKGMDMLSGVLMSLLKIVSADQGNRKELGLKVSAMPLMPETAPELTRLLLLPSQLLATNAPTAGGKNTAAAASSAPASTSPEQTTTGDETPDAVDDGAVKSEDGGEEEMDTDEPSIATASADASAAPASSSAQDEKTQQKEKEGAEESDDSEEEDFEDEDLTPQLVDILVRLAHTDFQDLEPTDKLRLLVALCGRVLSTTAIQDFQVEKRDDMRQLWRTRIEEGKEKKEKEVKEKKEKQAKKEEQLKKQQKLMKDAMDSFKVFSSKSDKAQATTASATAVPAGQSNSGTDVQGEDADAGGAKEANEEDTHAQRRPATERQMERERQLAKDKERRDREAKELQAQREAELREQKQLKFLNDIENCKRAFRLMPLGFDRFRRRCWSFHPSVLPGVFLEDDWSPDMPEVRTHGETTLQSSTTTTTTTSSTTVGNTSSVSSVVVGDTSCSSSAAGQITLTTSSLDAAGSSSTMAAASASADVAMDTDDTKPVAISQAPASTADGSVNSASASGAGVSAGRWRVFQSVAQFEQYVDSLTLTGAREKALREVFEKQKSALVLAIKKYSSNFLSNVDTASSGGEEEDAANASGDLSTNKLRDSYKEDLVEIAQRLYRGGLGDPGDLELFQARVATTDNMTDMRSLLLDVYTMINPRFTQGILCPPDVQETHLAMAKVEGKEKGFKMVPCRLAEWKQAVSAAGTLSRLHLLQAILDECIQWHKSAENARCKICRKKSDDVNMLLCDDCNQGFHIYCLRPVLHKIPSGHWACPSCQPLNARRTARGVSYNENSEEEEEEDNDEDEEEEESAESDSDESGAEEEEGGEEVEAEEESDANEDACTTCGAAGELLCCDTCPRVYHLECHVPPLRRAPRGKFVCYLCKNPRLATGRARLAASRSRSQTKSSRQGSRSRTASASKKSPSGRRGSRRRVYESEESNNDDDDADQTADGSHEEEEDEEVEDTRSRRGAASGRRRAVIQSNSEESDNDGDEEEDDDEEEEIEEASDNTDTEVQQPARRSASGGSRSAKRTTLQSKTNKSKRPGSSLSSRAPPAKRRVRQRVMDSDDERPSPSSATGTSRRGGRDSHNLKEIAGIINSVIAHGDAEPFALPVSLKDVPDYLEVVDEPMDFGTIKSRLKNMFYNELDPVLKDIALVFHNCDAYNHHTTDTYKCGAKVERYFCKLLKSQLKPVATRYSTVLSR
ncbi:tyrosine-protein kinase BAZ1B-like isoform X2 [Sycon ciliatum]|uniref:tyrosine-protein kinase BAZ1B-like isoform X2 n=1 Tax=Sycon ciliatum TaxID=27933 RepID=UPI0031F6BEF6